METQKGAYMDYSPFKSGLFLFPCWFGGVYFWVQVVQPSSRWLGLHEADLLTWLHEFGFRLGGPPTQYY